METKNKMYKFPSIEQFRHVIQAVQHRARYRGDDENGDPIYDMDAELPVLRYRGTVKLHGTNAAIVYTWNDFKAWYDFHAQSRRNVITPESDNAGFATFAYTSNTEKLLSLIMRAVGDDLGYTPQVVRVYGEWCGANIQKGMGISGLDKMFVIFAIKLDERWLTDDELVKVKIPEGRIYNILDYKTFDIDVDFNDPKTAAQQLAKLTDEVEAQCPVAKEFQKEGFGEGVVWHCITEGWEGSRYWFKVVGDKHKSSKTTEKVPIDPEKVESMNELVNNFLTESRLLQGIDYLKEQGLELTVRNTGPYLKWIYEDIVKEELDTIVENGFEPKEISGTISTKAREWFFAKLDEGLGL